MRRLHAKLKSVLLSFVLLTVLTVGCTGGGSDDVPVTKMPEGTGKPLNTSSSLTPAQQAEADERRKSGEAAGANMARAAQEMKEAQARSGGK